MSTEGVQREIDELIAAFCAGICALIRQTAADELRQAVAQAPDKPPAVSPPPPPARRRPAVRTKKADDKVQPPAATSAPAVEQTATEPPALDLTARVRQFVDRHAAYSAREIAEALAVRTVDVIDPLRVLVEQQHIYKRIEGGQARYYDQPPPPDDGDED